MEVQWRRGSLVRDWRGGGIGELREAKAELARVSARAEELQRGGSTAGLSSRGFCGWRRWCSGVLGRVTGEWVRGMERGGPPGTGAQERREIGALPRAVHGGNDVAAGGALGGAWQSRGGHSERGRGRWGAQARRVGASASRRWPGRRPRAAGGAAQRRRPEEQSKQAGWRKGKRD